VAPRWEPVATRRASSWRGRCRGGHAPGVFRRAESSAATFPAKVSRTDGGNKRCSPVPSTGVAPLIRRSGARPPDTLEKIKSEGPQIARVRARRRSLHNKNTSGWLLHRPLDVLISRDREGGGNSSRSRRRIRRRRHASRCSSRTGRPDRRDDDGHAAAAAEQGDFSLTFFYTGAQFLVKKAARSTASTHRGKRLVSRQHQRQIIRRKYPRRSCRVPRQPALQRSPRGGGCLHQRRIPAAGLKERRRPDDWSRGTSTGGTVRHGHAQGDASSRPSSTRPAKGFESASTLRSTTVVRTRQVPYDDGAGQGVLLKKSVVNYYVQVERALTGSRTWLLRLLTTLELSALAWLLAVALGILSGGLRRCRFPPALGRTFSSSSSQRSAAGVDVLLVLRRARCCPRRAGLGLQPRRRILAACRARVYQARVSRRYPLGHPVIRARSSRRRWPSASRLPGVASSSAVALRLIVRGNQRIVNLLKNRRALTISVAELTFQTRQMETYTAKVSRRAPPAR